MSVAAVIVVGAGGHAVVVADALLASGRSVVGFVDPAPGMQGRSMCGLPVLGGDEILTQHNRSEVVLANGIGGVGDSSVRRRVQQRLVDLGWRFVGVIHPSAIVSPFAAMAADTQLLARAVVQPNASIEEGCIVNTGAIVEHDALLGAWSHAAPGSTICGGVQVGGSCHVGAGAVVMQGIQLGPRTIVGAGAAVVRDFEGSGTLVGVPARKLEI
ncbi:UDP-N-acetylbacillosamine N-acetyltransferase [Ralstonia wenshanensis]|uniref:acetyltransferase n=1 Tax=Ralstonia wenshanensis TaxID=2842456 RepID=UPI0028F54596|nr:acetyltransferase [Ralstonia wenshanensis]CAJ0809882.1 UDP-N-acetylbacillosamine N-acetyltransferase [Ralstonia wenshanensis]